MIITANFLIFALLCGVAVKSIVDMSYCSARRSLLHVMKTHAPESFSEIPSVKFKSWEIVVLIVIDLLELLIIWYVLFAASFFMPVVLFSIVLANFFISWLAILCPTGYIFRSHITRVLWVNFSLNFGIFKNLICILLILIYLMILI